jgi:hypothetical protein
MFKPESREIRVSRLSTFMASFRNRLLIGVDQGVEDMKFYTHVGNLVAIGYLRVVIGKRGPYIEFDKKHIQWYAFSIPNEMKYRLNNGEVFYDEYHSTDSTWVKLYLQKRTVAYADYKIGKCYISPFDLLRDDVQPIII